MAVKPRRVIFCVSDHTGVTAEAFAQSVLSQFDDVDVSYARRPFVDNAEQVAAVVAEIDGIAAAGPAPIVFSSLINPDLQSQLRAASGLVIGLFDESMQRVTAELGMEPSSRVGSFHSVGDAGRYQLRLDAVDYSLMTDDGLGTEHYERADVIVIGVSRVGKTPSCLYLSLQYGVRAANYPLDPEDHAGIGLPPALGGFGPRLFGLTIEPRRLRAIRQQRRPDSKYADLEVCKREVAWAESLYTASGVPYLDTTSRSIEEITATIMATCGLARRLD